MLTFALSGLLIGATLGIQFAVVVLIPVMICAMLIAGAIATAANISVITAASGSALFLVALQIGYISAAALRIPHQRPINRMKRPRSAAGSGVQA
jgi:hypothetical protein